LRSQLFDKWLQFAGTPKKLDGCDLEKGAQKEGTGVWKARARKFYKFIANIRQFLVFEANLDTPGQDGLEHTLFALGRETVVAIVGYKHGFAPEMVGRERAALLRLKFVREFLKVFRDFRGRVQ
jgi:hypothetical protein